MIQTALIAISLSMDAFAVSVSSGICIKELNIKTALKGAFFFGLFQCVMPLVGWYLGNSFIQYIQDYDHWIAFILLGAIGLKMIKEALQKNKNDCEDPEDARNSKTDIRCFKTLLILALATSIDALAVGISLSVIGEDIWTAAVVIGVITFFISLFGFECGKRIGPYVEKKAEIFGGLVLIAIGTKILVEHLYL